MSPEGLCFSSSSCHLYSSPKGPSTFVFSSLPPILVTAASRFFPAFHAATALLQNFGHFLTDTVLEGFALKEISFVIERQKVRDVSTLLSSL